uniref:glycine betaine/L-proline ABC transporter permease ProW n=1 Tax=Thaumasiovibrio occultus TaxID=1891184 RepID=UPI000B351DC9|nr:glycine betaine/L-proline ABC transporter permease ProW [Thaumasiovibrio occultus]
MSEQLNQADANDATAQASATDTAFEGGATNIETGADASASSSETLAANETVSTNDPWAATEAPVDPWASSETSSDADPWSTGASDDAAANPWGETPDSSVSWLSDAAPAEAPTSFDWLNPFSEALIPLDEWARFGLDWIASTFRVFFKMISVPIELTLGNFEAWLMQVPATIMIVILGLVAWQLAGKRLGLATLVSCIVLGAIGVWEQSMVTFALVLTSVFFCLFLGLPLGILLASSERASSVARPIMDAMQTTPAFVYLVPIVMMFGIGNVSGVIVTIIFALPPIVRLTILGIRQVPVELIEAGHAFGADRFQMLFKVQLPLAAPTIMAGVNQTLMLALSMVVIASMISVGGLGQMVLQGMGRFDMGMATVGGTGIVIMAILMDRITQAMGKADRAKHIPWYKTGPLGLVSSLFESKGNAKSKHAQNH